jgi:ankyrin repeat protein
MGADFDLKNVNWRIRHSLATERGGMGLDCGKTRGQIDTKTARRSGRRERERQEREQQSGMGESQVVLDRALCDAAREGDLEHVRDLIQNGADVNAKDEDRWTALMRAAGNGHMDVVCFLIEHSADINAK